MLVGILGGGFGERREKGGEKGKIWDCKGVGGVRPAVADFDGSGAGGAGGRIWGGGTGGEAEKGNRGAKIEHLPAGREEGGTREKSKTA